eukprot:6203620-Pleurochrysis_carterae.AAC.7
MFFAREAKWSVFEVSSMFLADGETHAIIIVLPSPPMESISSRVSFESRYGMCPPRFFTSASAEITLPASK